MAVCVLIADDDPMLRNLLCDIVAKLGYTPIAAVNGRDALDQFFSHTDISLCILDVMMPLVNGWDVLAQIREKSDVSVLMLTALGDEQHELKGIKSGADDYIAKPFSYPILTARIEALLRRTQRGQNEVVSAGLITVDISAHKVTAAGTEISLNNKEFQLLVYLMKNQHIVLDREKILNKIWGYDSDSDGRTIDTHIKMLRAKLGGCGSYIQTVRGTGYMFEADNETKHTD